jgi:WD40 repeat protein
MKRLWSYAMTLVSVLGLWAGEPPARPILRLETGMHSAMIRRIAVDGSGRTLATASEDKTLRLWDTATGELLSTVRPPAGAGSEGMLKCCAFSPDARLVAVGGWTGWEWDGVSSIYLVEVATGHIVGRISGLPSLPYRLAYARDGRLAVCLWSGGVRVFRSDGTEAYRDANYGDQCYGADFDRAGRLVTVCWDGYLRLYGPDGASLAKVSVGGHPFTVRFSPDGTRVAVGFDQARNVEVRSGLDLSLLMTPDPTGINGSTFSVAWSPDGQTLYAAGSFALSGFRQVRAWSNGGRGPAMDYATKAEDSIMDLVCLPDRRLVWSSADPAWGILGGISRLGSVANFKRTPLAVDPAGTRVAFGYSWMEERPAVFDVPARDLKAGASQGLLAPRTTAPGVDLANWKHSQEPKLNGQALALDKYENSRSAALLLQGGLLLGADWNLYAFDAQGKKRWGVPAPGAGWAVNVSQDGALGVAAYGDGTIRWHRMSDGKELLAFFPHLDGRRWVAWTPSGYYDASPGGEDLIGWHLNHGKESAADFFPASRFRAQYYRPDIVAQVLSSLDEEAAIQVANAGRRQNAFVLEQALPPVVRILDPQQGARMEGSAATIHASVRHPRGAAIDSVWAAVDGRRVEVRGLRPQQEAGSDQVYTLEVPLPSQDCLVSVFAQSGSAVSEAASVRLLRARGPAPAPSQVGLPAPAFTIQPKLYVLAIGVGAYQRADLALDYPAKDARDFAAAMEAQKTRLYRDVDMRVLTDGEATRDSVLDGLEWLEHQVTAKDVAVVFLAGHGINDTGGQYYFLPANADPDRIKRTMVADSDVRSTLAKLPGKVVLFLDTCHSGNILGGVKQRGPSDLNGFINELSSAESGVVVFSASTGRQSSQESREWGNGAFTKAVIEGLRGRADFQHTGRVTLNMLDLYISERVKELTRGSQAPTTAKPNTIQDFPIAIVR